jgi:epoxide hydrolase 4
MKCMILFQDVKLHYVEKGDKSKELMLLVHGFPEFWYSWRHQIKEFSKDYW